MDMQEKLNRLFISDLDGTLLNDAAELSDFTVEILNRFIEKGMNFTIATARTAATVEEIMSRVNLRLPVILMNGSVVYDMKKKEYIHYEKIDEDVIEDIAYVMESKKISGFAYGMTDNRIVNYRGDRLSEPAKRFYIERVNKFKKVFVKVQSFDDIAYKNLIYISVIDSKKVIDGLYTALRDIEGINVVKYNDTYESKTWYLEIFSDKASKYYATMFVKNKFKFDHITCFGDNLNDIPLFSACDVRFAPKNAHEDIKKLATEIIDSNDENGVAKWIMQNIPKMLAKNGEI